MSVQKEERVSRVFESFPSKFRPRQSGGLPRAPSSADRRQGRVGQTPERQAQQKLHIYEGNQHSTALACREWHLYDTAPAGQHLVFDVVFDRVRQEIPVLEEDLQARKHVQIRRPECDTTALGLPDTAMKLDQKMY